MPTISQLPIRIESVYEEYAILDAQIKLLTNQKDELRDKILQDLINNEETTIDTNVGKFTVASVKSWTYTEKVAELEEEFKARKAHEQSTGDATYEEKPSLRFTQIKF